MQSEITTREITRRHFVGGSLALFAGTARLPVAAAGVGILDTSDPLANLEAVVRVQASLDEEDVPWWYNGIVLGVVGEAEPVPLFGFKDMELYRVRHLAGGEYELIGKTASFFRDLATGKWLTEFDNPWTGERQAVPAAVQGGGPGRGFNYSVQGIRATAFKDRIDAKPLLLVWTSVRDQLWLHNSTAYPPGMQSPRLQRQTMFVPVDAFADPGARRLPTIFSSTVLIPWRSRMNMGDRPGRLVWHAGGAKLDSIDQLPAEYRERAEKEYPGILTARPGDGGTPSVSH